MNNHQISCNLKFSVKVMMSKLQGASSAVRYQWVDSARGIAVFLVVLHHSLMIFVNKGNVAIPDWLTVVNNFFLLMRMPALCMISGFFIERSFKSRAKNFNKSRIAYFLYLYITWSFLYVVMQVGHIFTGASFDDVLNSVWKWVIIGVGLNSGLWYIFALFFYYAYYKIAYKWSKLVHLLIWVPLYILYSLDIIRTESWGWDHIFQYGIFFLIGAWWGPRLISLIPEMKISIYLFLTVLIFCLYAIYQAIFHNEKFFYADLFLAPIGVFWFLKSCEIIDRSLLRKVTHWVGKHTLPIYILHVAFLEIVGQVIARMVDGEFSILQQFTVPFIVPAIVLLVCLGIWKLTYKPFPFLYDVPKFLK